MLLCLPSQFEKLVADSPHKASVVAALQACSDYYGDETRALPFFPEYTGHRVAHVQNVLSAAAQLIDDDSWKLFAPNDAAALTGSILLHDAAMLLTEEGFLNLASNSQEPLVPEIDTKSWESEWQLFHSTARRWDQRTLERLFGSRSDYEEFLRFGDFPDWRTWNWGNRVLIGEFVRRNHARLAHEFAIEGVPGARQRLRLLDGPPDFLHLVGYVARSHNLPLRSTFAFLKNRFHGRVRILECRPVYLMVLLRIADFLEVHPSRTPQSSLQLRSLRSPISRLEWNANLAISEVRPDDEDEEAVFIRCNPLDSKQYLRVRRLLDDLQQELDYSWAVLGQVFSRQTDLKRLGIRLRRVKSNLDDPVAFSDSVEYVPGAFQFGVSTGDLLKRLTTPLYGDRPQVGIRELLQNAIDAVNELHAVNAFENENDEAQIVIRLDKQSNGSGTLTIEDFGVGMNIEIIRSYFLKAGATFRDSDAWRREYCSSAGTRVVRSGRFGIGVLAAFLLGNKIRVLTRHYQSPPNGALSFQAGVDDEQVEITKSKRDRPGTTIAVEISEAIFDQLTSNDPEWDWFRWEKPRVRRLVSGKEPRQVLVRIPMPGADLSDAWHRLPTSEFDDVVWTYGRAPRLVCNGVTIGNRASSRGYGDHFNWEGSQAKSNDVTVPIAVPYVAVTDRNGALPIDLQRFKLIGNRFPFRDELLRDAVADYVAFSLVTAPTCFPDFRRLHEFRKFLQYPGRETNRICSFCTYIDYLFAKDGVVPMHWANLRRFSPKLVNVIISLDDPPSGVMGWPSETVPFPYIPSELDTVVIARPQVHFGMDRSLPHVLCHLLGRVISAIGTHNFFYTANSGCRILIPEQWARIDEQNLQFSQTDLSGVSHRTLTIGDGSNHRLHLWEMGDSLPEVNEEWEHRMVSLIPAVIAGRFIVAEIVKPRVSYEKDSQFVQIWNSLITEPLIPYDLNRRRQVFSETYERIRPFIEKWERLIALGDVNWYRKFYRNPSGETL